MIPFDTKDYRAESTSGYTITAILAGIALLLLTAWMSERDHQAKVEQIKLASAGQCTE